MRKYEGRKSRTAFGNPKLVNTESMSCPFFTPNIIIYVLSFGKKRLVGLFSAGNLDTDVLLLIPCAFSIVFGVTFISVSKQTCETRENTESYDAN